MHVAGRGPVDGEQDVARGGLIGAAAKRQVLDVQQRVL
jgi:hypothetical protein